MRGALTFGGTRRSEGARVAYEAIEGIVGAETPLDRALDARRPSQTPQDPTQRNMRVCEFATQFSARRNRRETVKSYKSRALGKAGSGGFAHESGE